MESQDRGPTGDSPEIELEPLWLRRLEQVTFAGIFGMLSVAMLVNLILLPDILIAGSMLCFAGAAVVSFRAMGRSPKLYGWKRRPPEHVRPLLAHIRRIALILVLFVGGLLLPGLPEYLRG